MATQDFDNLSATYNKYLIILNDVRHSTTGSADLLMRFRVSGTTQTGSDYFGACRGFILGSASNTDFTGAAAQITLSNQVGEEPSGGTSAAFYITRNGANQVMVMGNNVSQIGQAYFTTLAGFNIGSTVTGFRLYLSTGNIYGTATIYGLET